MMRLNEEVAGSRLLFGVNRLGGVGVDLPRDTSPARERTIDAVLGRLRQGGEAPEERLLCDGQAERDGRDRGERAVEMGLVGVAARSSGLDIDTRRDHPYGAYRSVTIDPHYDTPRHITEREVEMAKDGGTSWRGSRRGSKRSSTQST